MPSTANARWRSRSIGAPSPARAERTAPGKAPRSDGSKSPARSTAKRSPRSIVAMRARPARPTRRPRSCDVLIRRTRRWRSDNRIAGERPAAAAADGLEHARHGSEAVEVQVVGSARLHHGVEHQPLDPVAVAERVPERDLGAVRGPEQRDLLLPEGLTEPLDVLHRVAARVEPPPRPEPACARARLGAGAQQVGLLERHGSATPPSVRSRAGRRRSDRGCGRRGRPRRAHRRRRRRWPTARVRRRAPPVAAGWPGCRAWIRLTYSEMLPGAAPEWSSGTWSRAHLKPKLPQRLKLSWAWAGAAKLARTAAAATRAAAFNTLPL